MVLFLIGVSASFIGQTVLNLIVEKYNKKSYIVFVIAFVIGTSAVLLTITEGIQAYLLTRTQLFKLLHKGYHFSQLVVIIASLGFVELPLAKQI